MYRLVVAGAFIVFLCNMIISYYHAWKLYSSIGDFPGRLAHVAVVAFDTVFALGTLVVSMGTLKNFEVGRRVWLAFVFGFFMTTWSNVRASMGGEWIFFITLQWQKISPTGWESLAAGLSTPAALVAIELLLSWMVANREKFVEGTAQENVAQQAGVSQEEIAQKVGVSQQKKSLRRGTPAQLRSSQMGASQVGVAQKVGAAQLGEVGDAQKSRLSQVGVSQKAVASQAGVSQERTLAQGEITQKTSSQFSQSTQSGVAAQSSQFTQSSQAMVSAQAEVGAAQEETSSQKETASQGDASKEEEIQKAIECALHIKQQEGDLPSRRKLAEVAGCSEWIARKALAELKKAV